MRRVSWWIVVMIGVANAATAAAAEPATAPATQPATQATTRPRAEPTLTRQPSPPKEALADPDVTQPEGPHRIVRHEPTYDVVPFDAADPPTLDERDIERSAHTAWNFYHDSWWWVTPLRWHTSDEGQWTVLVRIDQVHMELWLHTRLHLPPGGEEQAVAYEQARWEMVERHYATADDGARRALSRVIGRTFAGSGASYDAAETEAISAANAVFSHLYLLATRDIALESEIRLDTITDYGLKDGVDLSASQDAAIALVAFTDLYETYRQLLLSPAEQALLP